MATLRKNAFPCSNCRRQSLRCEWIPQKSTCVRCIRRGVACSGPSAASDKPPRVSACHRCRRRRIACHRLPGQTHCAGCIAARETCLWPETSPSTVSGELVAVVSHTRQKLDRRFLSYALSYHLMDLYVTHTGGKAVIAGSSHATPIEMQVARYGGKVSELNPENEILALACMLESITLSEHSSVVNDSQTLQLGKRSEYGHARRYALEALERNLQRRMQHALIREMATSKGVSETLANLCYLCFSSLREPVVLTFIREILEPLLDWETQLYIVHQIDVGEISRPVTGFLWRVAYDASPSFRAGPLAKRLLRLFLTRSEIKVTARGSFPPISTEKILSVLHGQASLNLEVEWTSQLAEFRRIRHLACFYMQTPLENFFTEAVQVLSGFSTMLEDTVVAVSHHPDFHASTLRSKEEGGPHRLISDFFTYTSMFYNTVFFFLEAVSLPGQEGFEGWKPQLEQMLARWLMNIAEWASLLFKYRDAFCEWELHEWLGQQVVSQLEEFGGAQRELMGRWVATHSSQAQRLLAPLDFISFERYEAADLATSIRNWVATAEEQRKFANSVVEATLNGLDAVDMELTDGPK